MDSGEYSIQTLSYNKNQSIIYQIDTIVTHTKKTKSQLICLRLLHFIRKSILCYQKFGFGMGVKIIDELNIDTSIVETMGHDKIVSIF